MASVIVHGQGLCRTLPLIITTPYTCQDARVGQELRPNEIIALWSIIQEGYI